ncbi:YecA family protein [Vibrio gazogenes]|uniref:Prepilin peptidase n=1 Tax=Vibrio gazogenes TaxID=687 RepID=A0A1Z2SCB4_VIBGA|nr:SEC-C metal-binding domain-containing protein [Vibrio gazogenes]ASA54767.1 prepilin peptidase [Vibrio gazogenes]
MTYQLLDVTELRTDESPLLIEGAILAANMACQPLEAHVWMSRLVAELTDTAEQALTVHYQQQYSALLSDQYCVAAFLDVTNQDDLAEFASGFMAIWPLLEPHWQQVAVSDGTQRMLQALLTTLMLAVDEAETRQQMKDAGIDEPPYLAEMVDHLDMMIHEVACAADEQQSGARAHRVNPYKTVGRNDSCPCGSGKKFKQCCLQTE